jgi:hypothetical protein
MLINPSPGYSVAVVFVSFAHRFSSQLFLSIPCFAQAFLNFANASLFKSKLFLSAQSTARAILRSADASHFLAFLCLCRPTLFLCRPQLFHSTAQRALAFSLLRFAPQGFAVAFLASISNALPC